MTDLDAVLASLEPELGTQRGPARPLEGGITNRNYRVTFGERDYVIRVSGKDTDVLGIDREHECTATRVAASLGVAPDVAAFLPGEECLVTRFVPGVPATPAQLSAEPLRSRVATMLRRVHDGPEIPGRFDAFTVVVEYRDLVVARGGSEPAAYAEAAAAAERVASVMTGPEHEPVACHNDLLAGNVLCDGDRVTIVDWEYSGMGERFFDLANLAVNNGFDDEASQGFLTAYFGEPPSARRRAALTLMRVMSDFREAMWGALQAVVSDMDVDYEAYADEHFARLLAAAADPRFEEALGAAAA